MFIRKAQVTIFIIIAVLIVALGTTVYFVYPKIFPSVEENKAQFVENYFLDCLEQKTIEGSRIMAMQGGYIELPEFEQGSQYMPFSNYFTFLGTQIPYWFYFSGNNLQKIQKPTLKDMNNQLASYLNDSITECNLDLFEIQGYNITYSYEKNSEADIQNNYIDINVRWPIVVEIDGKSVSLTNHKLRVRSNFGELYGDAEKLFNNEMETLFLENYSLDTLTLNAPLTGFELSCAPKIWQKSKIKQEVQQALEDNILTLKLKGNEYSLLNEDRKYFVYDSGDIKNQINFIYLKEYPMKFEIYPTEGDLMRADPVGNQPGIGLAGFCYVPYHFVYDMSFPVLVQITNGEEIFQFPILIVIDKTVPRNTSGLENISERIDFCAEQFRTQEVTISTFDNDNNALKTNVYFKCLDRTCNLGSTSKEGNYQKLTTKIPQCYNGNLIATAEGYRDLGITISSNEQFSTNLFLNKIYPISLDLILNENENAIVTFSSQGYNSFALYPEQKSINLSEGNYNVSVYVFKDSNIVLSQQTTQQCLEVPVGGIGSLLGLTKQECYDVTLPSQTISSVIIGGGNSKLNLLENELKNAEKIRIDFERFPEPKNLDEVTQSITGVGVSELSIRLS